MVKKGEYDMVDLFKSLKANYTISAAVCALLGLVLVIWPGATSQIICMLLGGVLLAYGILQIAIYLFNRERTIILQGMIVVETWVGLHMDLVIA